MCDSIGAVCRIWSNQTMDIIYTVTPCFTQQVKGYLCVWVCVCVISMSDYMHCVCTVSGFLCVCNKDHSLQLKLYLTWLLEGERSVLIQRSLSASDYWMTALIHPSSCFTSSCLSVLNTCNPCWYVDCSLRKKKGERNPACHFSLNRWKGERCSAGDSHSGAKSRPN